MPTVDLLVIGGGIHGTQVARDAALRGLSVVLVEKDDLASGTSSRSSKLVHGGIRYLETGQFGLVREALRERAILLETAPGLVRPLKFLLPFYKNDARSGRFVKLGLSLYDALSGKGGMPKHRGLAAAEALEREPHLPAADLTGAALFHDAQMDDAGVVVACAVAAAQAGALIRTRTEVTALTLSGATWRARIAPGEETIEARAVVNAAGPWVDEVRARTGTRAAATLRPTRGTHVVVPNLSEHALLLFARKDRRVFFVLPWGAWSLVGTTDTDDARPPDEVSPTVADVRYLWDEIAARWPGGPLPARSTSRVFAGVRSLARAASDHPWDNPREAQLVEERGLISLIGGKYTTARHLAERAVDRVVRHLGTRAADCSTRTAMLLGTLEASITRAAVDAAVEHQFAMRVEDVIFRRSRLWLDAVAARAAAPPVAAWMGERLGWSEERRAAEVSEVAGMLDFEERILGEARGEARS